MIEGQMGKGHLVHLTRPKQATEQSQENFHGPELLRVRGANLPRYPELKFGFPSRRKILKAWRAFKLNAVYIATEGPLGLSALNAAKTLEIPVIGGFHTYFHEYTRHFKLGFLQPAIASFLRYFH